MSDILARVFLCPLSTEIVEAVNDLYREGLPVAFLATINQVGPKTYTGFSRDSFAAICRAPWCRDHLGRYGEDVIDVIEQDEHYNVQCVHLHTTDRALTERVLRYYAGMTFEVGPGEDPGLPPDVSDLPNARWLSFPTGCKIDGLRNDQRLDYELCRKMRAHGRLLRGHNSDYCRPETMFALSGLVDAINIAPQCAVLQSTIMLQLALRDGVDISAWLAGDHRGKGVVGGGHYCYHLLPSDWRRDRRDDVVAAVRDNLGLLVKRFRWQGGS